MISALAGIAQVGNGGQVPGVCLCSYDLPHIHSECSSPEEVHGWQSLSVYEG